jgi:hypothetical protein
MKSAQKATGPEGTRPLLVTSFPCFRLLALMALGFLGRMNELDMVGQTRRAAPSRSGTSRGWSGGGGQGRRQELVIFRLGPKQVHRTRVVRKTLAIFVPVSEQLCSNPTHPLCSTFLSSTLPANFFALFILPARDDVGFLGPSGPPKRGALKLKAPGLKIRLARGEAIEEMG